MLNNVSKKSLEELTEYLREVNLRYKIRAIKLEQVQEKLAELRHQKLHNINVVLLFVATTFVIPLTIIVKLATLVL